MIIGSIIRNRRRDLHITGPELARRVGVVKSYISQVELGIIKEPSAKILYKICCVLGLDLIDLIKTEL